MDEDEFRFGGFVYEAVAVDDFGFGGAGLEPLAEGEVRLDELSEEPEVEADPVGEGLDEETVVEEEVRLDEFGFWLGVFGEEAVAEEEFRLDELSEEPEVETYPVAEELGMDEPVEFAVWEEFMFGDEFGDGSAV